MPRPIKNPKLGSALEKLKAAGVADLTARAEQGELARAFGRDREVEQLFDALLGRRGGLLLGPTDVGKTAVLHEAVVRMVRKQAPAALHYTRVAQLSTHTVLGGSRNSGEWSGKLQEILDAAIEGGSIALYFENIWNLRQAGTYSGHTTSRATRPAAAITRRRSLTLSGAGIEATEIVAEQGDCVLRFDDQEAEPGVAPGQPIVRDLTIRWVGAGLADVLSVRGGEALANTCQHNRGSGILVDDSAGPTLERNSCTENGRGISFAGAAGGTARDNECRANGEDGIVLADQAQPTIEANRCLDNGGHGIDISGGTRPTLEANDCRGNKGHDLNDIR